MDFALLLTGISCSVTLVLGVLGVQRENARSRAAADARLATDARRAALGVHPFSFTIDLDAPIVRREGDALVSLAITLTRFDGARVRLVEGTPVIADAGIAATERAPGERQIWMLCENDLSRTLASEYRRSDAPPTLEPRGGVYVMGTTVHAAPLALRAADADLSPVPLFIVLALWVALSLVPYAGPMASMIAVLVAGIEIAAALVTRGEHMGGLALLTSSVVQSRLREAREARRDDELD